MTRPLFTEKQYRVILIFVTSLFMLWGIAITMGEVLNKHFQNVLHVSKSDSGLVQFSIFGAYAIMGIPAGLFMKRFGYKKGVLLGLGLYAAGAFLFVPAANAGSFDFFRFALFILACGLATLETVAHPFVASLGDQRTSDQRLNFAQAFNGLGAVVGPLLGGYFILRATGADGLDSVKLLYVGIGVVITVIAVLFSLVRVPFALQDHHDAAATNLSGAAEEKPLIRNRHFVWAVVAQFFNVAAQGGTWAYFINYTVETNPGMSDERAAYFYSFSMVMMMVGRFVSTFLMRYVAPNKLLAYYAVANALLCVVISQRIPTVSFGALLMLNFFMSIMFPTIFSLGLKGLGRHTHQASSYIVMGVVGGAVFPPLMGLIANHDVALSYLLPIACYFFIFLYGFKFYKIESSGSKVLTSPNANSDDGAKASLLAKVENELRNLRLTVVDKNLTKPWGAYFVIDEGQAERFVAHFFPNIPAGTLKIGGKLSPKILFVAPHKRLSWQYHDRRAEIWKVIDGKVGIALSTDDAETTQVEHYVGDIIRIAQGERHRLIGTGEWGVVAEIWQHTDAVNPSDENDIVRVQDDFGR